jgi:threonine dehydrogenase-like Zn-dependent dehydrogenase
MVTHRFALGDAAGAYRLLAERPEEAVQVLFTYV